MKLHHRIHTHLKQHHKKYVGGLFAGFAVVKTFVLLVGALGIVQLGNTFAGGAPGGGDQQPDPLALNSGNVTQFCQTDATNCDLYNKGIISIAQDTFINFTNLGTLYLGRNNLTSISSGELPTQISYLSLQGNGISSLANFDFSGLPNINNLDIGGNNITSLSSGDIPANLTYLGLRDIGVSDFSHFDFSRLSQLRNLDISRNNVTSLDSLHLDGLSGLNQLSINNNLLTTLPEEIMGRTNLWIGRGLQTDNNCWDTSSMSEEFIDFITLHNHNTSRQTAISLSCPLTKQGVLRSTYRGDRGALSGLIFSISADQEEVVSGDTINYILHYENNSETIKHYGVMIRDYLPTTLDMMSSSLPATYVDHEVVYGGEDDICFQQFIQEGTGAYYKLVDDAIFGAFGASALQLAQMMLGYTGDESGVGTFFYDNMCLPAGRTNLNDCLTHEFDFGDTPQLSYPELLTVGSGCGVVGAPLAEPYYYRHIGYIGTGQSGDITISTQVNSTHTGGLIENIGEYYLNMVTQRTNDGSEEAAIFDGVRVTSIAPFECANVTDVTFKECEALVTFYNSMNGDNWTNNSGWLHSNTVGTWYGITVNDSHVTKIDLTKNGLSGNLIAIGLDSVNSITLKKNNISGSLDMFCSLPNLGNLNIHHNRFNGDIPECLIVGNIRGLIQNNYLNIGGLAPGGMTMLDTHFGGSSPEENWINQYTSADLSINSTTIKSLMGDRFTMTLEYNNNSSQTARSGVIYYDVIDGIDITDGKGGGFATGIVGTTYGEPGDPCFDTFYNSSTGLYRSAFENELIEKNGSGTTVMGRLQGKPFFYTGTQANAGNFLTNFLSSLTEQMYGTPMSFMDSVQQFLNFDISSVPNCGTGGRIAYIFDIGNISQTESPQTITINGSFSNELAASGFTNNLEISSTDLLRSDPVTGNNTISEAFTYVEPVFDCSTVTDITESECNVLVDFYNSTDGNNWTNNSGWLDSSTIADWYGIKLNAVGSNVSDINLQANNLSGTADLRGLGKLNNIKLSYNQLSSVNVDGLSNLQTLDLSSNVISNIYLGDHLDNVNFINLSTNSLTSIDLNGLPKLTTLGVSDNLFSGSLDIFCSLTGIEMLIVNHNQFNGDIPTCLEQLTKEGLVGDITYNYLNIDGITPTFISFLDIHFNDGLGWRTQYSSADLSVTGTIVSLSPTAFTLDITYNNFGPKSARPVVLYYDMVDGVSITTDRAYTTGIINKTYAEFGDPCFDEFYNEGTGGYLDAMNTFFDSQSPGLTLLTYLVSKLGFTGTEAEQGKAFYDYGMSQSGGKSLYLLLKEDMGVDLATIPNCGIGGKAAYIFTLNYVDDETGKEHEIPVGSGGTITITGTLAEGTKRFTNALEILSTNNLRVDLVPENNTVSFRYGPGGDPITTEMSFLREDKISGVFISTGTTVVVGDSTWNGSATISTKPYIGLPTNEIVKGTISINFGAPTTFDRPIKIIIPVETDGNYYITADHGDGPTTDGLTTNPSADSCGNGIPTLPSGEPVAYNGSAIASSGKLVTIYSCSASSFIAYTQTATPTPVNNPGGGGGGLEKDKCAPADCSTSYYDRNCGGCPGDKLIELVTNTHGAAGMQCNRYSNELNIAYNFALDNNITTIADCDKVNLDGQLLRSHMAKMMSNFAITTLGLKPDTGTVCTFTDMDKQSNEMQTYATLACQLGLMGRDADGKVSKTFNPDTIVTRAQFGTVLSRLLRGDKNNSGKLYYTKHLDALKTAGIMTKIDKPEQKELRGFTMLMLQRIMIKAASTINSSDKARPVRQSVQEYFNK